MKTAIATSNRQFFGTYTPEQLALYAKFESVEYPVDKFDAAFDWNAVATDDRDKIALKDYVQLKIDALECQIAELERERAVITYEYGI